VRAGNIDRQVELQSKSVKQDGYGEEIETWTRVATIWAGRKDLRGTEFFAAKQLSAEIACKWIVRYRNDITPYASRLVYEGNTYEVLAVIELGRREGLELMTDARVEA